MGVRNHTQLRDFNLSLIFRMILEDGPVSRTQMAERIGLSPSTVSVITGDLQAKGFIRECGRAGDHVGRPSILLEVNPEGGYFLSADLTSQNISLGVIDLSLKPIMTHVHHERMRQGEELYHQLVSAFRDFSSKCEARGLSLLGVGVASPGLVSPDGVVVEADNLGWQGMNLRTRLRNDLQMDVVVVENDINAAASGEFQYGSVRNQSVRNMMLVSIDTGIGCGLILDGKLFSGANGFAGEFGHVVVDPDGPPCACGRRGCLEAVASVPSMLRAYRELTEPSDLSASIDDLLHKASRRDDTRKNTVVHDDVPCRDVIAPGDAVAAEVVKRAAKRIGITIGSQVNVLNVDTVLLGGSIVQLSDWFFEQVRHTVIDVTLPAFRDSLVVRKSSLGIHAGLVGIASLCLLRYFDPD